MSISQFEFCEVCQRYIYAYYSLELHILRGHRGGEK